MGHQQPRTVFDSDAVPHSARISAWSDAVSRLLVPLRFTSRSQTIDGRIQELRTGEIRVIRCTASAHMGTRTPALAGGRGASQVKVAMPIRGTLTVEQDGRRMTLVPGELAVYSTSQTYRVGSDGAFDFAIALLPGDMAEDLEARVVDASARPIDRAAARGLRDALLGAAPGAAHDAELIADRLRLAVARARDVASAPSRRARLHEEALEIIERRLSQPGLGPQYLADALGVSLRTLYAAFAGSRRSVAATIRARRLERARDLLSRADHDDAAILEIAAEAGFDDGPHFSRLFRREFGAPPSEVRRRRLG
ncbi:MAG: hypothetical protein BGO95_09375 [Micrococcales bacterium 73-13]|nr:MAG: hypothetical protein BGO95_09375 [Micrococcales bacterium 73-13]